MPIGLKTIIALFFLGWSSLIAHANESVEPASIPITIQLKWFHQFQFAGYYAAVEQGFYQAEGLDVTLLERNLQKSAIAQVVDGEVEFAVSDAGLLLERMRGQPLVLIAQIYQHSPQILMTLKESGLDTPQKLRHKKIMLDTKGDSHIPVLAMLTDILGGNDQFEAIPLSYQVASLAQGDVDGLAGFITSQAFDLRALGAELSIIDPRYYGFDFYGDNLFTSEAYAKSNPEIVEKVKKATLRGWQYALTHREEMLELIQQKYNPVIPRERLEYESSIIVSMINAEQTPLGTISDKRFEGIARAYVDSKLVRHAGYLHGFVWQSGERIGDKNAIRPGPSWLTESEKEWLQEHPVIRVMNEPDYLPFDFIQEGEPKGFSIDYVNLLAKKINIELEFVQADFSTLIEKVKNREVDLMHSLFRYPPERESFLNFTKPYKESVNIIVTRKGEEVENGLTELGGRRVAHVPGDAASGLLERHFPTIKRIPVKDYESALVAVAMGKADATILELPSANHLIKKLLISNLSVNSELKMRQNIDYRYRMAVRKDWPELVPIIEKAMAQITSEEMSVLESKWLESNLHDSVAGPVPSSTDDLVFKAAMIMLFVIVLVGALFFFIERKTEFASVESIARATGIKLAVIFNMLVIALAFLLGVWAIDNIHSKVKDNLRTSLYTVMQTTLETLHIWVADKKRNLQYIASDKKLTDDVIQLLNEYQSRNESLTSEHYERLKTHFAELSEKNGTLGYYLIALDGTNLVTPLGDTEGQINLIKKQNESLFQYAVDGKSLFVAPILSDEMIDGIDNVKNELYPPALFFLVPLTGEDGRAIALIAERHDPFNEFSRITQLGRMGESGETYTFNRDGMLLTESRFQRQLLDNGLIDRIGQSILSVSVSSPNTKHSGTGSNTHSEPLSLTRMAISAVNGESNSDVDGYQDYRGVWVIGSWTWDNSLDLGITTEIDLDEAMSAYYSARNVIFITLLVIVIVSTSFTLIALLLGRRANRALLVAHNQLEARVAERTDELKKSEERFELAMKGANDGLWDWNFLTGEVYYSKRWSEMLGYTEVELAPTLETWSSLCHPDDARQTLMLIESCEAGKQDSFSLEFRMKHKQGHWVPILSRAYVCRNPETHQVTRFVGTHIDLTEQKQLEQALLQAKTDAEQASCAKSEFLANMSHEIRTPMNGVIGLLRQMLNHSLDDKQRERARIAQSSAKSLLSLINDILDFSKIEAGKLTLENVAFDPYKLLTDTMVPFEAVAQEKGIKLVADFSELIDAYLIGDPSRIRQVLVNLIANAIKFTSKGTVSIVASVDNYEQDRVKLHCQVSDTGIGIPEDKLNILFESFTQVDSSTTRKFGGSGLGLAICHQLCKMMNGNIQVSSQINQGSCFEFTVELTKAEISDELVDTGHQHENMNLAIQLPTKTSEQKEALEVEQATLANHWPEDTRILIVDDNPVNLIVAEGLMEEFGLNFKSVENGEQALQALSNARKPFSLILMDCEMPILDGYQTTAQIRNLQAGEDYQNIPIIAMTAHAMAGAKEKCISAGMDDYLAKPIDGADLLQMCKKWLIDLPSASIS